MTGDQLARAPDVLHHPPPRLFGIAALDPGEDRGVLLDVLLQQPRVPAQRRPGQVAGEASVQVRDRRDQAPVRGRLEDRLVEEVVGLHPRARVRPVGPPASRDERGDRPAEERLGLAEPAEVVVADVGRGELGREPFQLRADVVRLPDVSRGGAADDRAAMRQQLHDPGHLQLAQRLADGRPADPELLGEGFLPQARADGDRAAEDSSLDRSREPVDERRAVSRVDRGDGRHSLTAAVRRPSRTRRTPTSPTKTAKTVRRAAPGSESATSAPAAAPTAPTTPIASASGRSPTPRRHRVRLATIAVGRTTRSEVASASCCDIPTASTRKGTSSTPPPTPSRPASMPDAAPIATSASRSATELTRSPPSRRRPARGSRRTRA